MKIKHTKGPRKVTQSEIETYFAIDSKIKEKAKEILAKINEIRPVDGHEFLTNEESSIEIDDKDNYNFTVD